MIILPVDNTRVEETKRTNPKELSTFVGRVSCAHMGYAVRSLGDSRSAGEAQQEFHAQHATNASEKSDRGNGTRHATVRRRGGGGRFFQGFSHDWQILHDRPRTRQHSYMIMRRPAGKIKILS